MSKEMTHQEKSEAFKKLHAKVMQYDDAKLSGLPKGVIERIQSESGGKVDIGTLKTFVKLAKKMTADDFAESMVTGEFPALKLSNAEMALLNGGGLLMTLAGSAIGGLLSEGVGWVLCGLKVAAPLLRS